jgi:hypothetical protein
MRQKTSKSTQVRLIRINLAFLFFGALASAYFDNIFFILAAFAQKKYHPNG